MRIMTPEEVLRSVTAAAERRHARQLQALQKTVERRRHKILAEFTLAVETANDAFLLDKAKE